MPILLIPILFAAILFMTPLAFVTPAYQDSAPAMISPPTVQMHYTKAGIVEINTKTSATRFTPYKLVPQLDRRTMVAA